jgi:hypothetical protein
MLISLCARAKFGDSIEMGLVDEVGDALLQHCEGLLGYRLLKLLGLKVAA